MEIVDLLEYSEQALPKSLVELYEDNALAGDEMGLMAYLPFEEQYSTPNGIIEQRFSINDQRVFKDANGDVVKKVVPLVLGIQSDQVGELRFEMNGETLMPFDMTTSRHNVITYSADSHHGTLKAPVILQPVENERPYKIIEENHVIIIRNGERYNVTGKKL